jgi:hypothetical protein
VCVEVGLVAWMTWRSGVGLDDWFSGFGVN